MPRFQSSRGINHFDPQIPKVGGGKALKSPLCLTPPPYPNKFDKHGFQCELVETEEARIYAKYFRVDHLCKSTVVGLLMFAQKIRKASKPTNCVFVYIWSRYGICFELHFCKSKDS